MKGQFPKKELAKGEIDLAMAGYFKNLPEGYYQQTLFEDHFVCLAGSKNKFIGSKLTIDSYLICAHFLTTLNGDLDGVVDRALGKRKRKIAAGFSEFFTPSMVLNDGNYILTCLSRIADKIEKPFRLKRYNPPLDLPKVKISQVWHERTHKDPLHSWLRSQIKNCSGE